MERYVDVKEAKDRSCDVWLETQVWLKFVASIVWLYARFVMTGGLMQLALDPPLLRACLCPIGNASQAQTTPTTVPSFRAF